VGWTEADLPDLTARTVVVTGASAGLGLETTRALARAGAHVVLATRDAAKTEAASAAVRRAVPGALLEHVTLDLADLSSVRDAVAVIRERHDHLDAVVANAGLMATPETRTVDGFELQIGVNHLGHAAFVAGLLDRVEAAEAGRVVVVSSEMHRLGGLDDLQWNRRRYRRWSAYSASKLANLLYVLELHRRLDLAGRSTIAVAAHPGYAATELQGKGPTAQGGLSARISGLAMSLSNTLLAQTSAQGALPQLYATTAPDVTGGSYWGPQSLGGARGAPGRASRSAAARDGDVARRLFDVTEELTGADHGLPA
jgi:NAD(P)-dependent dehydrogenase (short-subunit alcohol dehydrogenase family)